MSLALLALRERLPATELFPLFDGRRPCARLREALLAQDRVLELAHGPAEGAIVLGVPHHAAPGVDRIAERRPEGARKSDENAALFALRAFEVLRARDVPCRTVIAAHATDHDPNKLATSPYCESALEHAPALLFECHGSSWSTPHELELSSGRNARAAPLRLGALLARATRGRYSLAAQVEPGQRRAKRLGRAGEPLGDTTLKFPALATESLALAERRGVPAFHLEATPRFRTHRVSGLELTDDGDCLGRALAAALFGYASAEVP